MAEIAGLVVGGVALASLFSTCTECFEDVQLVRHYGRDFEVLAVKLQLAELRLNLWGRTVWITDTDTGQVGVNETWQREWPHVREGVGAALAGLTQLFQDIKRMREKYGLEQADNTQEALMSGSESGSSAVTGNPTATIDVVATLQNQNTSTAFRDLRDNFRRAIVLRQKGTTLVKKSVWAIHDRAKFVDLIADVSAYLDSLEAISAQIGVLTEQRRMFEARISQVSAPDSVQLLEDAVQGQEGEHGRQDESLQGEGGPRGHVETTASAPAPAPAPAPATAPASLGHEYIKAVVRGRARQINGNVGVGAVQGHTGNRYIEPEANDDSLQVNGELSLSNEAFQALVGR